MNRQLILVNTRTSIPKGAKDLKTVISANEPAASMSKLDSLAMHDLRYSLCLKKRIGGVWFKPALVG